MRIWLASGILIAAGVVAAGQGGAPRSVWDGVYTESQAVRGEKVSAEHCARCHGATLTGAEAAPALVGDLFNANWEGVPLGDLLERIRVSMPQDMPGSLSRQQNVDVIAYMLKLGKVPVGTVELVTDSAVLGAITFQGKPVAGR
jgi:mono/diheme cytochrome c family protein